MTFSTSLQSHALTPHGAKALVGQSCRPAAMRAGEVAAKNEDFVGFQLGDSFGGKSSVVHICKIFSLQKYIKNLCIFANAYLEEEFL